MGSVRTETVGEVEYVTDGWVRHWPNITAFMGGNISPAMVKKLARDYGFPLHKLPPNGVPAIIKSEANLWLRHFSEISSPFRFQKVTGAALQAKNGLYKGCVVKVPRYKVEDRSDLAENEKIKRNARV